MAMSQAGSGVRPAAGKRSARLARLGLSGLLLMSSATGTMAGTAAASTGDGTLTVEVLRDFFGTGVINTTMDVPQRGMSVDVSDSAGHHVTGITDATGKVVVSASTVLTGGQYRVDVSVPAPYSDYLRAAPASTAANHFDSFTSFADVSDGKNASVITGVWDAADYALPDTRYFVPIQNGAKGTDTRALVAFGTNTRGTCPTDVACPAVIDTQAQVGTTFGLAYDKDRKRLFQSAFARRYALYGPDGGNAIYTVPADGGSAPTLFAKVPLATVTPHDIANMKKDGGFTNAPGKESIGGIALSEDGSTLYAVNLLSRTLVSFDATGNTALLPESTVPIPDPGCASPTDWRPFGVTTHDNKLYVGGVCSAESTQDRSDLKAVVYLYDGKRFTTVLAHALTDERGAVFIGSPSQGQNNHWNPWDTKLSDWDKFQPSGTTAFIDPQPELSSLAFARDGSMILGFRDRFMDVLGANGLDPRPGNDNPELGMSGGDINMACADPAGGYSWEGTGNCPNHAKPANDHGEASSVVEYFPGDFFAGGHEETALGAVAYIPQQQWVVSTEFDPTVHIETDGTGYHNIVTGEGPGNKPAANAYEFVGQEANGFGKAGGLGDIAYAAANAPIQIGNLVWFDGDHNGIQDPGSVPLPNATINLMDANGKRVATTRTDAAGEYYFGGVGATYQLTPGGKYTVEFDVCTANTSKVPSRPPAEDLRFTLPTVGEDRSHDSNVVPPTSGQLCDGNAPVVAPKAPGGVDHTIDAGVYLPVAAPPPSSTPPSSSPPSPMPTNPAPTNPAPVGTHAGSLAYTGVPGLPMLIILGVLLFGAGAALAFAGRKRRANQG
ncbi:SdrD B-like domain-containing protein [Amycolatopsis pigmentata]|uniref:SdrD B-like domain-containing protein n=1 Tax=Amycolatopsis pigmentata TaxID=450801 RepID=A0ABW5FY15_9PSEU